MAGARSISGIVAAALLLGHQRLVRVPDWRTEMSVARYAGRAILALAVVTVANVRPASASICDLSSAVSNPGLTCGPTGQVDWSSTNSSSNISMGAIFTADDPHPTGTGYIRSFVRLQSNGTEQGYNTNARPVQ